MKKPRPRGQGLIYSLELFALVERLVTLTEELQQQREQVDEVQVQRQRTGDRRAFRDIAAGGGIAIDVLVLQPLRIPGGETREDQDADHRYDELQRRTRQEQVDQARNDDADQAHEQERADAAHVTPCGVAVEAQ